MGEYLYQFLLLCSAAFHIQAQGLSWSSSPCAKDLADISVFPGDSGYNSSSHIWNPEYAYILPAFVALPKTIADVQRCLACAYEHSVPFTVKCGGHSADGMSTINGTDGAFVIFLSEMKAVKLDVTNAADVVVQAGAIYEEIYNSLKGTKSVIVGGDCPTVGVSGYTLGGGMSIISRKYGIGIDNVKSLTMVTANGSQVVTANPSSNTDLYWALRGGGGGNFGVVVDFTLQLHQAYPSYTYGYIVFMKDNIPSVLSMIGAEDYDVELTIPVVLRPGNVLNVTYLNNGPLSNDSATKLNELKKFASEHESHEYLTYWAARDATGLQPHPDSGYPFMIRSCFFKTISAEVSKILTATAVPDECAHSFNHLGGNIDQYGPRDMAYSHRGNKFELYSFCMYKNDTEKDNQRKYLYDLYDSFDTAGQCEGNYVNDPVLDLHDWQHKYYGDNYERLVDIQKKWNPLEKGTYHFLQSIGSSYNPTYT